MQDTPRPSLADAIARDLLRRQEAPPRPDILTCHACGRGLIYRGPDGCRRFCSDRCREGYDAGHPAHDPSHHHKDNQRWYNLPIGKHGFLIECFGCNRTFDSRGPRCCSPECERKYRERGEIDKLKAEAGCSTSPSLEPSANARNAARISPGGATAGPSRKQPGSARQNARKGPRGGIAAPVTPCPSKRKSNAHFTGLFLGVPLHRPPGRGRGYHKPGLPPLGAPSSRHDY